MYTWKKGLIQHQTYQCGKEPQYNCPIESCNYKCKMKGDLKRHIAKKHNEYYYPCFDSDYNPDMPWLSC